MDMLLGAHTSIAGGVHHALLHGQTIGATTIQMFTANQKQWKGKEIAPDEVERWKQSLSDTGIKQVMSHDSYLINLGSADPDILQKSRQCFRDELFRCKQLGLSYLNFHPGAAVKCEANECLDKIVESLLGIQDLMEDAPGLRLLIEATAGQGSSVGHRFEHLAYIVEKVKDKLPIGVCIDTCHIFVAGYDIRTAEDWEKTLTEFERIVGLKHLYAFHLNDSMKGLGSRVDRHQDIGKGQIGLESFKVLMNHPKTRNLPKYLETPGGMESWGQEIKLLKELLI